MQVVVSIFAVVSTVTCAIIWGLHQYAYPSAQQRSQGMVERKFSESGGFWGVIRLYDYCYWRENGTLARERVQPLRGAVMATVISSLFILAVGVLLWLWGIIHYPGKETICCIFVVALSVSTCVIIPDQFVKYAINRIST